MIRITAFVTDLDAVTARAYFRFEDDTGVGIRRIRIVDRDGVSVEPPVPGGCPAIFEFELDIHRMRLPLFAESTDCQDRITPGSETGPLLPEYAIGGPIADPVLPCPSSPREVCPPTTSGCDVADTDIGAVAAEMPAVCEECDRLRRTEQAAREEAIGLWFAAAVLFVAALVLGILAMVVGVWFAALVFGALAAAALVAASALADRAIAADRRATDLRRRREQCEERLAALRDVYDDALERQGFHCCACDLISEFVPC
jgi:hypothetical protein